MMKSASSPEAVSVCLSRESKPLLIDIHEAARLLSVKVSRLRLAVFRKEIPYRKIGRLVRFVPRELEAWIESDTSRKHSD